MNAPARRLVFGFMSGTSMDGVDGAAVEIIGAGLEMNAIFLRLVSAPLNGLSETMRRIASGEIDSEDAIERAAAQLGEIHAELGAELAREFGVPDLACAHGQTVRHQPPDSVQLFDPAPLLRAVSCPVVFDLRRADLEAGGQGAPITPIADWALFRASDESRAIVNLGGFCNATLLAAGGDPTTLHAQDVCACNQVMDAVARRALGAACDEGGEAACAGTASETAALELVRLLETQSRSGRSLGTHDEAAAWVNAWIDRLEPADLAASAAEAIGAVIGSHLAEVDQVLLAGGGARNRALVEAITRSCASPIALVDDLGVPAQAREAVCMALLGALCEDGVAITLPQVTGCATPAPVAGVWMRPASMDDAVA